MVGGKENRKCTLSGSKLGLKEVLSGKERTEEPAANFRYYSRLGRKAAS